MKKLIIASIFAAAAMLPATAHAQWAGQWQPATTTAQPTNTTSTGVPAPVTGNGTWQPGQPAWGTFGGNSPVMDANSGRYISDGRVENPVNHVVYDEPGRRELYQSQAVGNYFNMGMSAIGLLAQVFAPRQGQPAAAAPAQPANTLAECSANGQRTGIYVENADGNGLARCNALMNRP